ncbi:MAG: SurA N-terminal domain-containing protein [Rhodospirillaceae bacterium]
MLQLIRGTVGTWIVKGLFVLLIASFAIWGIGDIFRGRGPASSIAEIGPTKIAASELDQEVRKQINRLRPMFGGQFDLEQAKQMGLIGQTLDQMIQRALLDLAARDAGLNAGDELVRRRIQSIPGFRTPQGQFDPELLRRALAANSLSEGVLIGMIREETGRGLVMGAISAGAAAPAPLVDALYRFRQEKRVAETITLANDKMPEPATPDAAELTKYHEDKAVRFTAPEYRTLTVGLLTVDELAKTIEPTEDEIKAAFDARADEFQTGERRSFVQVLVDGEDKARAMAEKARALKGDLEAAAKAEGVEASSIGPAAESEVPEIGASVFALEAGIVPDPFKSDLGWHVVKVTKVEPAKTRTLADVRDQVVEQLRKDRAADAMPRFVNKVEDALAGGATLEEAAAKLRFPLLKVASSDSDGNAADGSKVKDVADLPAVLTAAFALTQGNRSPVTEGTDNNSFVVRVDAIAPSHLKPLAEVRDQVIAAWKGEQRAKAAAAKAEEIENQLKAGGTPESVARAAGAVASVTEPLTRTPSTGTTSLPPALLHSLFTLAPGGTARAPAADGQVVVRLKDIVPADPAAAAGAVKGLAESERKAVAEDLLTQFTDGLRLAYPVRINNEYIRTMFSSN